MTLTSPTIPNPLDTLESKAAGNSIGAKLSTILAKYVLILMLGFIISILFLLVSWVSFLSQPPNYKLGNTVFEVISPAPFAQVTGSATVKVNLVTSEEPKNLRAYVKSGDSTPQELQVAQVGKDIISLTGDWDSLGAKQNSFIELTIYNVSSPDHPIIVNYTRIPVSIVNS